MRRILVTGCAGFIGSHICEHLLKAGAQVLGIDNFSSYYDKGTKTANLESILPYKHFEFRELCVGNYEGLMQLEFEIDLVIHLAATPGVVPSLTNIQTYIDNNISKYNSLLSYMSAKKIKQLIFASSSSVYGNIALKNYSESDPLQPISPYGFTKQAGEQLNYQYHYLHQISVVNLRLFSVYGERMRPDLALPKFVSRIEQNKPIYLYNNGNDYRDFTYITDVVDAFARTIEYLEKMPTVYQTLNIGNNKPIQMRKVVRMLEKLTEKKASLVGLEKRRGEVLQTSADITQAQKILGYQPTVHIEEGIERYYKWYKKSCLVLQKLS